MKWRFDYGDRPWHRWFAWYPVSIECSEMRVWLEWVEKKTDNCQGYLISRYRLP